MLDRRRASRRSPSGDDAMSRVRLRAGRELSVVNASRVGLSVEGPVRLLPGSRLDVHVFTPRGRVLARTRVMRVVVVAVGATSVTYRSALAFECEIDVGFGGNQMPTTDDQEATSTGTAYPGETRAVVPVDKNS